MINTFSQRRFCPIYTFSRLTLCGTGNHPPHPDGVGLLAVAGDLDARTILNGNDIFTEFKGALTEQYVCQQIISELSAVPYYWSAESSSAV